MPNWILKLTDAGTPVVQDGRPIYVDEATNQESALDVNQLHDKILQLTKESKTRRLEAEQASGRLSDLTKKLPEVEDLDAWLAQATDAIEKAKNLAEGDLVNADKVERLKAEWQAISKDMTDKISRKDAQIRQLVVSNRFATCDLFAGPEPKTVLPPNIAEAYFGSHFKVEEDKQGGLKLVAYDSNGEPIQSRERLGEEAQFEEAIQILFERHPDRDRLLRNPGGSGSGSTGGTTPTRPKNELEALKIALGKATSARDRIALTRRIHALQQAKG